MSRGSGLWGSGELLSELLDWWKRTVGGYRRFAGRIADQSRTIRQENYFGVARRTNDDFRTVQVDLHGGDAELKEFTKAMRIGDRIRAFCNDGVIEAEKVSQTRFKLIYEVKTTGLID